MWDVVGRETVTSQKQSGHTLIKEHPTLLCRTVCSPSRTRVSKVCFPPSHLHVDHGLPPCTLLNNRPLHLMAHHRHAAGLQTKALRLHLLLYGALHLRALHLQQRALCSSSSVDGVRGQWAGLGALHLGALHLQQRALYVGNI